MSTLITKKGMEYRCEWDSETDILRTIRTQWSPDIPTEAELNPEPSKWTSLGYGVEVGHLIVPREDVENRFIDDTVSDEGETRLKIVAMRMTQASKRPELTFENVLGIGQWALGRLNELRHGHSGLLGMLPEGMPKPMTLVEAADKLAEAARLMFGDTRTQDRIRAQTGEDEHDRLDRTLSDYYAVRKLYE